MKKPRATTPVKPATATAPIPSAQLDRATGAGSRFIVVFDIPMNHHRHVARLAHAPARARRARR